MSPWLENGLRIGLIMLTGHEILMRAQPSRKKTGIYFLISGGEIVYVGKSINIDQRIWNKDGQKWKSRSWEAWHWIECDVSQLDELERQYIDALSPKWNCDTETRVKRGEYVYKKPELLVRHGRRSPASV